MIYLVLAGLAASFVAGKLYGATIQKKAVTVALAAFTEAKSALLSAVTRAKADVAAEADRLDALVKKYL